jgi:exopolysaccharide biosynthesis protein
VNESEVAENSKTQEGNITWFTRTRSARTVIGNDQEGRFVVLQIDGKTNLKGFDIYSLNLAKKA